MKYQKKHSISSAAAANFPNNAATNPNSDAGDQNYKVPFDDVQYWWKVTEDML